MLKTKKAVIKKALHRYRRGHGFKSSTGLSVTVCLLEKTGTELNACRKMPPSGPWVSPKATKLKFAESKQSFPSF